jgi:hypothetical protein
LNKWKNILCNRKEKFQSQFFLIGSILDDANKNLNERVRN